MQRRRLLVEQIHTNSRLGRVTWDYEIFIVSMMDTHNTSITSTVFFIVIDITNTNKRSYLQNEYVQMNINVAFVFFHNSQAIVKSITPQGTH